ncbi:carboxylesterase 1D-like [Haliotis cracherodii]|uniref:carboxylesterase 1D-like n=1 Tax=Haliotis cracherodii TaxID=6455 RepID=UPI0039E884A1
MRWFSVIRVLLFIAMTFTTTLGQGDPTVTTNLGRMFGRVRRFGNEFVYQFLGVRYAVAPIGRLRFKKPVPRGRWTGTLDASRFGPSCAQLGNTQFLPNRATTEDCLLLNIYVPRTLAPNATKSVMIWIHGGGFVSGQGMSFDGSNLAITGDVIVVTVNYRLDVFGFLSTGDGSSLGNYGLWDQQMAMRFIRDNIAAFGGNPNSMTIFGESGGGYSVGLHALSPLSQGLFQRVICESGVGLSPRAIAFDPVNFTRRVSDNLRCTTLNGDGSLNTTSFMACLRRRNTNEILQASAQARRPSELVWRLEIAPTVDGELIPRRPEFLISRENTHFYNPMPDIDFMAGANNAEGSLVFWPLRNFQRNLNFSVNEGIPARVLCKNIAPSLANDYYNRSTEIAEGMCNLYSTTRGIVEQGRNIVNLYGDMMFVAPTVMSTIMHARNKNGRSTYLYLFSQQPRPTASPRWFVGAGHGAELAYVFGRRVINPALSLQMMKYWSNFAKFGNPNGSPESERLQWEQFDVPRKDYVNLGPTIQALRDLWPDRMRFWNSFVPEALDRFPRNADTPTTTDPNFWSTNRGQGQNDKGRGQEQGRSPATASSTSGTIRYLGNDIAYPRNPRIYMSPNVRLFRPRVGVANPSKHALNPRTHATNSEIHVLNPRGHTWNPRGHGVASRGYSHHREGHIEYPIGAELKPSGHVSIQYSIHVSGQ